MGRGGRPHARSAIITRFVFIYLFITLSTGLEYGVPIEIKSWDSQRAPVSHMVDVTNGFGLKLLAEHSFYNDNNIAFSPYGLMGILVALYEGVDGESSYQIQRSVQLPWNRSVMRIGFRDVHRTLKTYFVPKEGFLAGLALNNENVTFNEGYIKILRFYGFDLENDSNSDNNTSVTSNGQTTTQVPTNTSPDDNKISTTPTLSTKEETTPILNIQTIDINSPKEDTSTYSANVPSTLMSTTEILSASIEPSTTTTTEQATTQTTTSEPQAIIDASTVQATETQTIKTETTSAIVNDITDMTLTTAMESSTSPSTDINTQTTTQSENLPSTLQEMVTVATTTNSDTSTTAESTTSTLETLQRRKKSIVDFIYTNPPYIQEFDSYRSFHVGSIMSDSNEDYNKMFAVNGLRSIEVTYMHYDAILDYAFLPHLEAAALRLPLDSERYYLLVVLPTRRGVVELGRLLARMARESDLSDIYSALHPCRVRAAVPSFIVKGHVTLTTDLQKLGIHDVFEPRQHDFTPMTRQHGVYVRSIEQAVSVAIRKYQPDNPKAYLPNHSLVQFSATYPFLYFVMDANIHVSLIAGKMVDPLNTRIL